MAVLWQALSQGPLVALGIDAQQAVVEIPSREWIYVRLREEGERDVLNDDAVGRPEPFTGVTLRQSDVLRLWPVTGEVPVLPAAITKGRPAPGKKARSSQQLDRTKEVLGNKFPEGAPPDLPDREIQRRIADVFRAKGWKLPSVDTIARARGRR